MIYRTTAVTADHTELQVGSPGSSRCYRVRIRGDVVLTAWQLRKVRRGRPWQRRQGRIAAADLPNAVRRAVERWLVEGDSYPVGYTAKEW